MVSFTKNVMAPCSLTNVKMTSDHKMLFSDGCNFSCLVGCNPSGKKLLLVGHCFAEIDAGPRIA
jgi:hypothetical protein